MITLDTIGRLCRCSEIADKIVPQYRNGQRSYSCRGTIAKRWQAAWDAAYLALGGDPKDDTL